MTAHEPLYMLWYSDDKYLATAQKIAAGAQRYTDRFGTRPLVVLVCLADSAVLVDGLTIIPTSRITANNYQAVNTSSFQVIIGFLPAFRCKKFFAPGCLEYCTSTLNDISYRP